MAMTYTNPCCRPVSVLMRSILSRRLGEERASRCATTQPRQARTARRVLRWRSADTPRGGERASRALWESNAVVTNFESPCRHTAVVLVQSSPSRRLGKESAPRSATTQPRQVHTARCAPRAVGRYSTGRYARGACAIGFKHGYRDRHKPVLPACRSDGAVEPQPAAWQGARLALRHNTTTPSPRCAAHAPRAVG